VTRPLLHHRGLEPCWVPHRRMVHAELWTRWLALFHGPDICSILLVMVTREVRKPMTTTRLVTIG
jgi:hypothetical protein